MSRETVSLAVNTVLSRRRGPNRVEVETHLPYVMARQWWGDLDQSRPVGIQQITEGVLKLTDDPRDPSEGGVYLASRQTAAITLPNTIARPDMQGSEKTKAVFLFGEGLGRHALMSLAPPFAQRIGTAIAELPHADTLAQDVGGLVLATLQVQLDEMEGTTPPSLRNPLTPEFVFRAFPEFVL